MNASRHKCADDSELYDVAIVGGGPAGLSAALWLGRYLHSVVLVDSGDPRNWETTHVNGYLGQPEVRPGQLREIGRGEARKYGATLVDGFVTRVHGEGDELFILEYDPIEITKAAADSPGPGAPREPDDNEPLPQTCRLQAKRLLLAFGLRDEWPKLPGLRQVYGTTAHVCPDCDGYDTQNCRVLVIANGRKAVGMALALRTWTKDIVICTNGCESDLDDELRERLDSLRIPVLDHAIECVNQRESHVQSVDLVGGEQLEVDKIFFALSQRPADDLAAQLHCERDNDGQIVVDARFHTSVCNVFAAGDIVPGPQLAIAAAAEGAMAAMSIHRSLVPEEYKLPSREGDSAKREAGAKTGAETSAAQKRSPPAVLASGRLPGQ